MRTVAQVGGHRDDVNAVAYAERDAPNVIFSGSDDHFVKVGVCSSWLSWAVLDCTGREPREAGDSSAALLLLTRRLRLIAACT